ncbi:hypothetical protein JHK85_015665 [Glycine max]|nr:hypothetical protein JHK85_015665 [Glycine max]KAG5045901.1 hypothetical protein JHK86_015307 [Glycine max]
MNEFLYSALRTSPLRKEVSCCRGNFSCFVILRACHHVLYDPSFQAVLGFPFVVCFTDSDYKLKIAGKQPLRFQDKAAYSYPLRIPAVNDDNPAGDYVIVIGAYS